MNNVVKVLKTHTMKIVLILVVIFFWFMTRGSSILMPANVTALINQNAYVYVLGTGMMMCMLIKGNIDLSVGAVVCFVDTVGAILMVGNITGYVFFMKKMRDVVSSGKKRTISGCSSGLFCLRSSSSAIWSWPLRLTRTWSRR